MKILLANHQLADRAGSELYSFELATALKDAGHSVAAFTFNAGKIAAALTAQGITVYGPDDVDRIEAFAPEAIHVHHTPCLYFLGGLRLNAPVVHSVLGVIPSLESAPIVWEGVGQALAVSEEVRDALRGSRFAQAVPVEVLRNWFDDRALTREATRAPAQVRRIAVVTNHLDGALGHALNGICAARPEVSWTHFGMPGNVVELSRATLEPFDLVITIGRTALLAGAIGKPVLLYDVHGSDGLLTAEALPKVSARNFSGRVEGLRPSGQELEHLLFDAAPRVRVDEVAERMWTEFRLTARVKTLERIYQRLRASGPALSEASRSAYGREGRIHADVTTSERHWREGARRAEEELNTRVRELEAERAMLSAERAQTQALTGERDQVRTERARTLTELEGMAGHLRALGGQVTTLERTLAEVREERDALEREGRQLRDELAAHEQRWRHVENSLKWRAFASLGRLKDRVLPKGTRPRHVYDRALATIKKRG